MWGGRSGGLGVGWKVRRLGVGWEGERVRCGVGGQEGGRLGRSLAFLKGSTPARGVQRGSL